MKGKDSSIQEVFLPEIKSKGISLFLKREDLLHPIISGNKYRKLFYNIQVAKKSGAKQLVTFGGAYSNHILATAGAGKEFGFRTIGVIRGEELGVDLEKTLNENATLKQARDFGMEFVFISRSEYKLKNTQEFLSQLQDKFKDCYILPEGGTNDLAIKGCEEIVSEATANFDVICTAVGTGGTISGIINASKSSQRILGFPALKGSFLKAEIENNVSKTNWNLESNYHFGGYAKINEELITFMNDFYKETNILLDPIYTGKMVYGVLDLIRKDAFESGTKILLIHTGGLQGIRGMNVLLEKKGLPILANIE
ncbi:1-aminocyclopropane-1-carboxylate deaminase/D-cysteine desulfhydrase [Flavicella marina]|uniref:1-aminocyclopropane-1-carboxylate deaminase/D-cysteine desulfhydrase n=1 Tax=Flavicella marina TaxID=1475951 RepID=UPI001264AA77|nr:pyridoxal-phosphate dependent enzyme [Flavicella marina]